MFKEKKNLPQAYIYNITETLKYADIKVKL